MHRSRYVIYRKALGMLCFLLAFGMMTCAFPTSAKTVEDAETNDTVTVIMLVNNVQRGSRIGKDDVKAVEVKNTNIPANIISDSEKVVHLYAKEDLYAGNYVGKEQVSDQTVTRVNPNLLRQPIVRSKDDYVFVTDYVVPNTGECLAVYLQEIIDKNPQKTIYFPDGEYVISTPLFTSGVCRESVSIRLSDGAVIKASKNFKARGGNALIHLGGKEHMHDMVLIGSYYVFSGGTLDGNMVANGLEVDSGRESVIRDVCIKNPKSVGIYVDRCAEYGSSDLDFEDITIIGSGMYGCKGVYVIGSDNTFSNIRIYNMSVGFELSSGGNLIKSIYVYNSAESISPVNVTQGLKVAHDNWISQCYVLNASTAFVLEYGIELWDCSAEWTTDKIKSQTFAEYTGSGLIMSGCRADFYNCEEANTAMFRESNSPKLIEATAVGGTLTDGTYRKHLAYPNAIISRS